MPLAPFALLGVAVWMSSTGLSPRDGGIQEPSQNANLSISLETLAGELLEALPTEKVNLYVSRLDVKQLDTQSESIQEAKGDYLSGLLQTWLHEQKPPHVTVLSRGHDQDIDSVLEKALLEGARRIFTHEEDNLGKIERISHVVLGQVFEGVEDGSKLDLQIKLVDLKSNVLSFRRVRIAPNPFRSPKDIEPLPTGDQESEKTPSEVEIPKVVELLKRGGQEFGTPFEGKVGPGDSHDTWRFSAPFDGIAIVEIENVMSPGVNGAGVGRVRLLDEAGNQVLPICKRLLPGQTKKAAHRVLLEKGKTYVLDISALRDDVGRYRALVGLTRLEAKRSNRPQGLEIGVPFEDVVGEQGNKVDSWPFVAPFDGTATIEIENLVRGKVKGAGVGRVRLLEESGRLVQLICKRLLPSQTKKANKRPLLKKGTTYILEVSTYKEHVGRYRAFVGLQRIETEATPDDASPENLVLGTPLRGIVGGEGRTLASLSFVAKDEGPVNVEIENVMTKGVKGATLGRARLLDPSGKVILLICNRLQPGRSKRPKKCPSLEAGKEYTLEVAAFKEDIGRFRVLVGQ